MASEAQRRACAKYASEKTVQVALKFFKATDDDILARLEEAGESEGKQTYIKRLIRTDIEKRP